MKSKTKKYPTKEQVLDWVIYHVEMMEGLELYRLALNIGSITDDDYANFIKQAPTKEWYN